MRCRRQFVLFLSHRSLFLFVFLLQRTTAIVARLTSARRRPTLPAAPLFVGPPRSIPEFQASSPSCFFTPTGRRSSNPRRRLCFSPRPHGASSGRHLSSQTSHRATFPRAPRSSQAYPRRARALEQPARRRAPTATAARRGQLAAGHHPADRHHKSKPQLTLVQPSHPRP
jgi:hypothetical protein